MGNFFPKWTNTLPWKAAIILGVMAVAIVGGVWYYFTPKYTRVGYMPTQPVPFSHVLHVQELGMDCRYCHSFVEVASHSNIPSVQTCMSCHTQVKADSPRLEAIRAAWNGGQGDGPPVHWVRIHRVPDYAYFNHAAHVNRGVSCYSCHGAINQMQVVWHDKPLSMAWCLECHRAPENHLRPPEEIYNMDWRPETRQAQLDLGRQFKEQWNVNPPVSCGGCHR